MRGKIPPIFLNFFGYLIIAFTEASPHNNIPRGKGLMSEAGERELGAIVNSEVPFGKASQLMESGFASSPACLENGTGCPAYLNPLIIDSIQVIQLRLNSHVN